MLRGLISAVAAVLITIGTLMSAGCEIKDPDNETTTTTTCAEETTTTTSTGIAVTTTSSVLADIDITTEDYGMTFASLPEGFFEMGCTENDRACKSNESPRHTVTVSAFKMSVYEITQKQWESVMGSNPSYYTNCGDDCPVEQVSWDDIQDFIDELNLQTGKSYRLPTEAEWEYAARAGTATKYTCGDNATCLDDIAWYDSNADGQTHPVGQKLPNAWGLHDMSGNIWEWVQDWYDQNYYAARPEFDPQGPDNGTARVYRGGGWGSDTRNCRTSHRNDRTPSIDAIFLGVRLVLP